MTKVKDQLRQLSRGTRQPEKFSRPIFVDTNIISYLGDKKKMPHVFSVFLDIKKIIGDHRLTISQYTKYELLRAGTPDASQLVDLVEKFENFEVTNDILLVAALLFFYLEEIQIKILMMEIQ